MINKILRQMYDFIFVNIREIIWKYISERYFYMAFTKYNFLTKALLRGKIYGRIIAKNMVSSFFVPPVCNDVFVKNYRSC